MDAAWWSPEWSEDQLERVLVRFEASLGYTTSFWHTLRHSRVLFDRTVLASCFDILFAVNRVPPPVEKQLRVCEWNRRNGRDEQTRIIRQVLYL